MNAVILIWKKTPLTDQTNYEGQPEKEAEKSPAAAKEEVESELFQFGDLVDILDTDEGADTTGPSTLSGS